jgi:hypothetical protein
MLSNYFHRSRVLAMTTLNLGSEFLFFVRH